VKQRRKAIGWRAFFIALYHIWEKDDVSDSAAALTYYGILALFPFLLFVVTLGGLLLSPTAVDGIVRDLATVTPQQVTQIIEGRLISLQQRSSGRLLTIGLIGAIWAASGAVTSLMKALNRCYGVQETRPFWKRRAIAIGMTFVTGLLSIVSALILFAVPALGHYLGGSLGAIVSAARYVVGGGLVMVLWALLYSLLPNTRSRFRLFSAGSVVGVVVWLVASWGFGAYVRHFGKYEAIYGALGGVIVLLVWMWLSSVVVLLGAEINKLLQSSREPRHEAPASAAIEPRSSRDPQPTPG